MEWNKWKTCYSHEDFLNLNKTEDIYRYVGGSKSSETNPIPENGFIMSDRIMIPLIKASVPDIINASPWLTNDVITYHSLSRDTIYGDPAKALTPIPYSKVMIYVFLAWFYCFKSGRYCCLNVKQQETIFIRHEKSIVFDIFYHLLRTFQFLHSLRIQNLASLWYKIL